MAWAASLLNQKCHELANSSAGNLTTVQEVLHKLNAESLVQTDQSHLFRQRGLTGGEAVSGVEPGPKLSLHMRNMLAC